MQLKDSFFAIFIMAAASLHLKEGINHKIQKLQPSNFFQTKSANNIHTQEQQQSRLNTFESIDYTTHSFLQTQIIDSCQPKSTINFSKMVLSQPRSAYFHGDLYKCLQYSDLKYVRIQTSTQIYFSQHFFGVCLPSECNSQVVKNSVQEFLKENQQNNTIFKYTEIETVPQYPITWLTFTTLLIISILIVVSAISTCSDVNQSEGFISVLNLRNNPLFKEQANDNRLKILDGIRAISFLAIFMAHFYGYHSKYQPVSFNTNSKMYPSYILLFLQFPFICVDLFLFLSGTMLGIYLIKQTKQQTLKLKQLCLIILYRWLRIIASYSFAMLIYYSVLVHTGSGPLWDHLQQLTLPCQHLWQELLFVSNIINKMSNICIGWTWYLQVDFQLFIWCLIIFYIYQRHRIAAVALAISANLIALLLQYKNAYQNNITIIYDVHSLYNKFPYMDQYIKPWNNITSYQFGFFFGIIYGEYIKQKQRRLMGLDEEQISSFLSEIEQECQTTLNFKYYLPIIGSFVLFAILVIPSTLLFGFQWPDQFHALYVVTYRTMGVLGVTLMILPSLLGFKDNLLNTFLSCNFFQFISKISFSGYLLHLMVIFRMAYSTKYDYYFSYRIAFVLMLSAYAQAIFIGTIFYLIVEYPIGSFQNKFVKQRLEKAKLYSTSIQTTEQ